MAEPPHHHFTIPPERWESVQQNLGEAPLRPPWPMDFFGGKFPENPTHRIHGAAIYGNMDPINIPPMLAYIPAPWILWAMDGNVNPGLIRWYMIFRQSLY